MIGLLFGLIAIDGNLIPAGPRPKPHIKAVNKSFNVPKCGSELIKYIIPTKTVANADMIMEDHP